MTSLQIIFITNFNDFALFYKYRVQYVQLACLHPHLWHHNYYHPCIQTSQVLHVPCLQLAELSRLDSKTEVYYPNPNPLRKAFSDWKIHWYTKY